MNPALFSLPEIILNDREEPDRTQSGSLSFSDSSPHYQQLLPVSQEELDLYRLYEPVLQRFCPSELRLLTGESVPPKPQTLAEMLQMRSSPDQREDTLSSTQRDSNQQCVQQQIPNSTGHVQAQAQNCPSFLNVLPGVWPQTLTPGAGSQPGFTPLLPELIITPCSPQDSHWLNMCPIASTPNSSGSSPYVLVPISSPPEFGLSPCLLPPSWLLVPEVRPSWCLCPQAVPVHQPCGPDTERTAGQVVSGKEQTEGQAKSEEEEQKNKTPNKDKPQANNSGKKRTKKSKVPPGSLPSLDEESLAEHAFEEYMSIMDSIKIQEGAGTKENENTEDPGGSFLQYLNDMCSDKDFVKEVESMLDGEYLDLLVSSDPVPVDLLPLEIQEHGVGSTLNTKDLDPSLSSNPEPVELPEERLLFEELQRTLQEILRPSSVTPVTKETSLVEGTSQRAQAPILDPPGSQSDANPNCDNLEARDNGALVLAPAATGDESEEASTSLSNLGDTRSAQTPQELQDGPRPVDPLASESPSTSRVSGSTEDAGAIDVKDPAPDFRADLLTVRPPEGTGSPALSSLALKTLPCPLANFSNLGAFPPADSRFPPVNVNLSESVPDKETVCEHYASPDLDDVGTAAAQKQTASREERTFERKEENKEGIIKGTNTRHSQRLSGQIEKEKAGPSGERTIERAQERKPSEKRVRKTVKLTPERDGAYEKQTRRSSGGRQPFKREESDFREQSRATKAANISEQFSEIGEKEHHQRLTAEVQKLEVEGGEQCEADNPNVSAETGAENSHLSKTPQEEKEPGEERKEEGIQVWSFVRRRRSGSREPRGKIKRLESSPKKATEDATEQQISSPTKRSRNGGDKVESVEEANDANNACSTGCKTNKSSPQSPKVHTDTRSTEDSTKADQRGPESPKEGQLDEITCEKTPDLTRPEAQQHSKVTGTETRDSRSQTVSKKAGIQEKKAAEATRQLSDHEPAAGGNDERINREEAKRPSLTLSPMKRHRNERGVCEESEEKGKETETEIISASPTKRGRRKRGAEANAERAGEQTARGKEVSRDKDEAETRRKASPPSTRSSTRAKDGKISNASAGGDASSATGTGTSREKTCSPRHPPRRNQTQLSKNLPAKYKDFVLLRKTSKRQLDKQKVKAGKGKKKTLRGRRETV